MGVITSVRNIRGEMNIHPSKKVNILIDMPEIEDIDIVNQNMVHIKNLARVDTVDVGQSVPKPEASATAVFGMNQVHVLLKGLIDFKEEIRRLNKEIKKVQKEIEISDKRLSNRGFMERAPSEIINKVREKVESMKGKLEKLEKNLNFFEAVND